MAALSVDPPERSARYQALLSLPFELLCDPDRQVVRAWDLYNRWEHGGVARPAVFVMDPPDGRIRIRSIDRIASRVPPERILAALEAVKARQPRRQLVMPKLGPTLGALSSR